MRPKAQDVTPEAGGNVQRCVCKGNSRHSGHPNSCFWIRDRGGSITDRILDMHGYLCDYILWEVGVFLYSFLEECNLGTDGGTKA